MKTWKNCFQKMKTTFQEWRRICLTAHGFFLHVCKRGMTSHTYTCMNTHMYFGSACRQLHWRTQNFIHIHLHTPSYICMHKSMQKYIQYTYVAKTNVWKGAKGISTKKNWREHTLILTSTYVYIHVHTHSEAQVYLHIHWTTAWSRWKRSRWNSAKNNN